jgi:hypothetical protein
VNENAIGLFTDEGVLKQRCGHRYACVVVAALSSVFQYPRSQPQPYIELARRPKRVRVSRSWRRW